MQQREIIDEKKLTKSEILKIKSDPISQIERYRIQIITIRLQKEVKFLKSQRSKLEKNLEVERKRAPVILREHQEAGNMLVKLIIRLTDTLFLMKKELNLALNRLKETKEHFVGEEILKKLSLKEILTKIENKILNFQSGDLTKNFTIVKKKLKSAERIFDFKKSQKLYEKNLKKIENFRSKIGNFEDNYDDNTSEISKEK